MFKFTKELLSSQNQKGVAIILAIFSTIMILYIVNEVTYDTNVEYLIHAQSVNRLKAYYAARSGVEMSLLRIKVYDKVRKQLGENAKGKMGGMLNLVWSFPLGWPPVPPENTSTVEKDNIQDKVKLSEMDATFTTLIEDEGSKIDINDLASPSKSIRESTRKQILKILENKITTDRDWSEKASDLKTEVLVNNLTDWVDADTTSANGGGEREAYENIPQGMPTYPPNRAFRTLEEIRLVAGMKDLYFDLLAPRLTVFGAKGINVNTATRDVLQSFDSSMTDEIVNAILKRRSTPEEGGQFSDANDFWNFAEGKGARISPEAKTDTPLIFDSVMNFRIRSTGAAGKATREIEAIVYNIDEVANTVNKKIAEENKDQNGGAGGPGKPTPTPTPAANNNQNSSKGPPRIVYWLEK